MVSVALVEEGLYVGANRRLILSNKKLCLCDVPAKTCAEIENDVKCHAEQSGILVRNHCPMAKVVSIDVFGGEKWAKAKNIAEAIEWASRQKIEIIFVGSATISLIDAEVLKQACQLAVTCGSIVIAPVDNFTGEGYPAKLETVVGVVASDDICDDELIWLERNNVNIVAYGGGLVESGNATKQTIPKSSYAAARCAGIIANMWSQSPSAKNSDIINQLKEKRGQKNHNYHIYVGAKRIDLGGWRRIIGLRNKQLIYDKYNPMPIRHALKIGSENLCKGMPLICQTTSLKSKYSQLSRKQIVVHNANKSLSIADSIIITGDTKKTEASYWIHMAWKNNKNIIITSEKLGCQVESDLSMARENGSKIWMPSLTIQPAPKWYLRKRRRELSIPCILVISNYANGRTLGNCKKQISLMSKEINDNLIWITDMCDGWLGGFDFCVPINQIDGSSALSLDTIMSVIHHEIRRRVHEVEAKAIGVIITQPLFIQWQHGQAMISPWVQALISICNPRIIILASGDISPMWLETSYTNYLISQFDTSCIRLVCDKKRKEGSKYPKSSESVRNCIQSGSVSKFEIADLAKWKQLYQFAVYDKMAGR